MQCAYYWPKATVVLPFWAILIWPLIVISTGWRRNKRNTQDICTICIGKTARSLSYVVRMTLTFDLLPSGSIHAKGLPAM